MAGIRAPSLCQCAPKPKGVFQSTVEAIWSGLNGGGAIPDDRREAQIAHIELLTGLWTAPSPPHEALEIVHLAGVNEKDAYLGADAELLFDRGRYRDGGRGPDQAGVPAPEPT